MAEAIDGNEAVSRLEPFLGRDGARLRLVQAMREGLATGAKLFTATYEDSSGEIRSPSTHQIVRIPSDFWLRTHALEGFYRPEDGRGGSLSRWDALLFERIDIVNRPDGVAGEWIRTRRVEGLGVDPGALEKLVALYAGRVPAADNDGGPADELLTPIRHTAAAERDCEVSLRRLFEEMSGDDTKKKAWFEPIVRNATGASERAFDRVWALLAPEYGRNQGGRPKKPPHQKPPHQ